MRRIAFILIFLCARFVVAAELSTADTRIVLHADDRGVVIEKLQSVVSGDNWIDHPIVMPLLKSAAPWKFVNEHADAQHSTQTFTFENASPKFILRSIWRARPGRGPIEHWIEIDNKSADRVTIGQQESLQLSSLAISDSNATKLWWIKRGGSNATVQGGTFVESLPLKQELNLASNPEDGGSPVPWIAVQNGERGGLYVGWEFSGLGRVAAKSDASTNSIDVRVGLHPDFKTDIEPSETFRVPPAFVGCYAGDIDDGSYSLHRFILEKLRPRVPKNYADPTLAYNLYLDAGGNKATEADVLRSVATCHDIGFETFMPDAMWFPSTGDWRWDPARFPHGVTPIEQAVHAAGMKLALWCAWTNGGVSDDPGALSIRGKVAHPEWFRSDVPPDWQPAAFSGAQLCLGSDDAKNWAIQKTQWLVKNHKLDYLKHDISPIITSCTRTTHRHHYGTDASYWATMGYYEVQQKLLDANPGLMLENCSGGGQIKDFGIVQRTHYTVATDTLSNLPDRQSIYDSTFALPPLVLQAYTYDNYYPVKGDYAGTFFWRSGMMSAWQIDPTDTATWTEGERDSRRRSTQIYKEWIRPMLQDVKVHHVLPRPDGLHWDGIFYFSEPAQRGMLYVFRPDAADDRCTVRLKGLQASKKYWIWGEDVSLAPAELSGDQLMRDGLTVALPTRYSSDLIYVQDAALGQPNEVDPPGEFQLSDATVSAGTFNTSAKLNWQPSPHAKSYRVIVSATPDFNQLVADTTVIKNEATIARLPADHDFFWKAEAIGWGGRRAQTGAAGHFHTPRLEKLAGITFVSDMPWIKSNAGAGNTVHRDNNLTGRTISIAQKPYEKGIWTHSNQDGSPADVVIDLTQHHFARFRADCGVEDSANGGTLQFEVLVDDQSKAKTDVLTAGKMQPIDVDVRGAKTIRLRVLNGGDGYSCDHAAWGYARFLDSDKDFVPSANR